MGGRGEHPDGAKRIDRYGWALVAAVGLLAYSNCFEGQLYLDDDIVIKAAEDRVRSGALVPHPLELRWLGNWSFDVGALVFGTALPAFHAVNLAIHLLAAVMVWALVARTLALPRFAGRFDGRAGWLATAVAGLWVVHPLTTQAVTYLCQRFESQMALFALVSVYGALRGATARAGRLWWYSLSVVVAYAATVTKEPALVLPCVIFVYDRLFLAGSWRGAVVRRWALYIGLVASVIPAVAVALALPVPAPPPPPIESPARLSAPDTVGSGTTQYVSAGFSTAGVSPWEYLRSQPGVLLHYLRLSAVPVPLVLDYGWPVARRWWQIWPPGAVVVVLVCATGWGVWRGAAGSVLGVWFFGFLTLTSSFVPIADLAFEHRMYLPLVAVVTGIVLAADRVLGWAAHRLSWRPGPVRAGALLATAAALALLTAARNEDYRDPIRMYETMLERVPENGRAWFNLGIAYLRQNRPAEAIGAFRKGLQYPSEATRAQLRSVFTYYGQALIDAGDLDEAIAVYRRAIALNCDMPFAHNQLGQLLTRTGRYDEAEAELRVAARREPEKPNGPHNLGVLRMHQGRAADAVPQFQMALRRDPKYLPAALGLAHALSESGHPAEARRVFGAVQQVQPDWFQKPIDLSWQMSTHWDPRARYPAESLRLARLVLAGTGTNDPGVLDVLAAALAANGEFEDADRTAGRAVVAARSAGQAALAAELERRRALYARRQPYREAAPR